MNELIQKSASEIVDLLATKQITPLEAVEASAERIAQVEPFINAMPTLCIEKAIDRAKHLTGQNDLADKSQRGYLFGLPISVKDLTETAGVRTTFGSPIYEDYIPKISDILVQQLIERGAIIMGKSNTPEFGAGASTFNEVFGLTRNPWDTEKSVAGSSGGACASVASGQVWLATGSDLGGSLRTPASFNSVVGMRPSPGRVPRDRVHDPFSCLHVQGPIARNTTDLALFLDAMSGYSPFDPLSYPAPPASYQSAVDRAQAPRKIAYSPDLGITRVSPQVDEICRNAVRLFEKSGTVIDETCSNFSGAVESFDVLRGASFACGLAKEYKKRRDLLKPEIVWNIERGLKLTVDDIARAEQTQSKIFRSLIRLFESYDLLVCPCAIVPPFDVDIRYIESIDDHKFSTYYEWIAITFALTLTSCPVLAIPAGFTTDGLPVGLQIVAPPRREDLLLAAGHLLESETAIPGKLPIMPVSVNTTDL